MLQFIATAIFTGLILYLTTKLASVTMSYTGLNRLLDIDSILKNTPAQACFIMFMIQSFIMVSVLTFALRISNHIIVSLDILYFLSTLMLILFHNLKESPKRLLSLI